jgi:phytoene dehydrogenase-like protein
MKNITIIGGGLGGLTAGALLSQEGYKITLLEQHTIVGGCATTFKRKDFICEVGLHEMDGVYSNPQIKKIFEKLDVYKNIEFEKAPEFFEVTTKNNTYHIPDGKENAKNALKEYFPQEENGIEKYFQLIQDISDAFDKLEDLKLQHYLFFPFYFYKVFQYKNKTVSEVLNSIINNEELKFVLNANVQYYNDTPDTLSFLLHAVAQYSYYKGGGYFIKGGSGRLSEYLASIILKNNGEIITKANVIAANEKEVSYMKKNELHTLTTDKVISNLSPKTTYKLFDKPYNETKEYGDALLTTYIGFSLNLKDIYGTKAYSNFIFDDIENIQEYNQMLKRDITRRGFVFVDYSQIDAKLTKDDSKSFGVTCTIDYLKEWENLSKEEYKNKKTELEKSIVSKLEKYYPNISDHIEYIETGTAKTVKSYIKTPKGTAYGYKPTPKQFFKIPQSKDKKIDNLYFVGQWIIAGGFRPSISSGYLCYKEIIK